MILISKEGKEFKIQRKYVELSKLLAGQEQNTEPIELLEVDTKTLNLIVDYLNHFKGVAPLEIEKPLKSNNLKLAIDEWSFNFIDSLSFDDILELSCAANYMDIICLVDLVCSKIASMCKDKTQEEISIMFGAKEQFTEEENLKIKEENKWIEDNL